MSYPIKVDEDFYVLWSSVVDAATGWGTREEVEAMMMEDQIKHAERSIERSLHWADHKASRPRRSDSLLVMEGSGGPGELSMKDLREYITLMDQGRDVEAGHLVKPRPDEGW